MKKNEAIKIRKKKTIEKARDIGHYLINVTAEDFRQNKPCVNDLIDLYEKAYTELQAQRVKDRDKVVEAIEQYVSRDTREIILKAIDKIYKEV